MLMAIETKVEPLSPSLARTGPLGGSNGILDAPPAQAADQPRCAWLAHADISQMHVQVWGMHVRYQPSSRLRCMMHAGRGTLSP